MALFNWKNRGGSNDSGDGGNGFVPQPDKAARWFAHGRTSFDTGNFDYALMCYASGLKLDPTDTSAHDAMWNAGIRYFQSKGKPATGKEVRQIEGDKPQPVDKLAAAEFVWMKDINNVNLAVKLLEAAAEARQHTFGKWLAPKLMNMLRRQSPPSKSLKALFVQAKDNFKLLEEWNAALESGQLAVAIDPTDSKLADEIRQLSAQRAISQGGYEQVANQEGGFRSFVKDADRQRELEESESISGSAGAEERNLERARLDYENNPTSPEAIGKYASLLRKRQTPESEAKAIEIYLKGFEATNEYRFRMEAGEIRLAQMRRRVRAAMDKASGQPADSAAAREAEALRQELLSQESAEYRERAARYPTDRRIKFDLGRNEFELGRYEEAMAAFQACKDEPRLRVQAGHLLGKCFAAEGWHQEALGEFREALNVIDATERDRELDIRYDLMLSLMALAREERSIAYAKEALDICSQIARKDITFRDIRTKRKELDAIIKELGGPGAV